MAVALPSKSLEDFYSSVLSKEPSVRLDCFAGLENYLSDENAAIDCADLTGFVDGLIKWVEGSNFRIACNGLRALDLFLERLGSEEFERYVENVVSVTIDRLGDAKDQVREAAANLLINLMTNYNPQRLWDLIQPSAFDHKQFRIKEEVQRLLCRTLNDFGASAVQLNKLVPLVCKLISDSNGTVRQQATETLVEIYRHVGEKVRGDIAKRGIPEAKLKQLYEKFDEVIASGRMLANPSDSVDDSRLKSTTSRSRLNSDSSTSSRSRPTTGIPTRSSVPSRPRSTSTNSTRTVPSARGAAASGAIDETSFEEAFEAVPSVMISTGKDVENHLASVREILADTNNDWEKRVDALKKLRSLICAGAENYDEFFRNLRQLDLPLVATVKDLRSQIVREVCITLAFMSVRLINRFDRTAESVLPAMINLIQNSAKVISTSGVVANRYLVSNTQSQKLIPLILAGVESKSKEIRRHTYELLVIVLTQWELGAMEKHGQAIQGAIKRGLSDADPDARVFARKAFGFFREQFGSLAEVLLASLEPSKRKTLMGEMSNASSTHSLASVGSSRIRSVRESPAKQNRMGSTDKQDSSNSLARSSSANELALRKKNAASTGLNTSLSSSTTRPQALPTAKPTSTSSRPPQTVSQSTPGSRSTSPHSLRSSHYLSSTTRTPTNARSRLPMGSNNGSRISSRESSPGRTPGSAYGIATKRRLGRPRGAASEYGAGSRRVSGSLYGDSGDDASETSSICSERAPEDIADILRRMSSSEWAERKESLTSLYHITRSGRVFSPPELKRLTDLLTKRFYDPHSQVFSTFLDILPDFIHAYKRDLHDWLYALLTRLLIRLGAPDVLESNSKKLRHSLEAVHNSFDLHAQFSVLIRFINDNSSAPNLKVKEILLRFLQQVLQHLQASDIGNTADGRIALQKIVNWSSEPKSTELRKASQAVIFALHRLNEPEFSSMLSTLPQTYQNAATKIIQSASESDYDFFRRSSSSTTDPPMPSYASDMRILMENMQALNVNTRQDDLSLINSSASQSKDQRSLIPIRHYTPSTYRSNEPSDNIAETNDPPAAIDIALNVANNPSLSKDQRQHALRSIFKFAKVDDAETWDLAFSKTLNVLTQILDNNQDEITHKVYSLRILRELLISHAELFSNYFELTIFRILKAQSETESEITRSAEQAAHAAAEHLPPASTIRVLKPIIEQAKYPLNQSAIAMLQKTIDLMSKELCLELMPEMVPPLLTSWDNETSSVRKAAVFCLVSVYMVAGDAVRTHLHKLSASKLKLLNVYISKAQQQSTSTGNNA